MIPFTRLYADKNGESHFNDIEIALAATEYAPPLPPLDLSSFTRFRVISWIVIVPAGKKHETN